MISSERLAELRLAATQVRLDCIKMVRSCRSGHPSASFSLADILVALFHDHLTIRPDDPAWDDRDRFILSKGHGAPALYSLLSRTGYFDRAEQESLRRVDSRLQGHPDRLRTPGVDASTGSLGMGLSMGVGMAMAARLAGRGNRVYVVLGDGELDEGQVWEAMLAAAHLRLDNLVCIVDRNGTQCDGDTETVMALEPLAEKWAAFGWHVQEVDGHSLEELDEAIRTAQQAEGRPAVVIARTVKGKGVSAIEGRSEVYGVLPDALFDEIETELRDRIEEQAVDRGARSPIEATR
ncbi:transketolase [Phaeacidiphilus oryzae]|uniref:transketolase n=1 Tax=Phaeacidiphilus oryzae TaxID=348818 RepID=UPI00055B80BC|nr:transketolase [Phaeacidiphilus oryzae]